MNQFNKEILDALSSDSKTSLKDVFRNQLEQTVNTLLQEELSAVLGYQPMRHISILRRRWSLKGLFNHLNDWPR